MDDMSDEPDNVLSFEEAKRKHDAKLVKLADVKAERETPVFGENSQIEPTGRVEADGRVAKAFAKYGSHKGRQHRKNKKR